jgi:3-hydroxyisobutyrate dehydrogenase-like beta-hydroxyacid dehydrogenase
MARRIVEAGYPLTLWARRPESYAPYADTAAVTAMSPAEVGAASDLVGICVLADADVDQVVGGVLEGMASGGIVAIHSTVHPDTCRRLAGDAATKGVTVVDAPVSGGGIAAAEHRLLVMVGGPDDAVAAARPVFETFGNPVIHLGPLGSGQVVKLVNNLVMTAHLGIAADAFALADALGIDRDALGEAMGHGSGASASLGILARSGGSLETFGRFAGPLLRKDVDIMAELGPDAAELLAVARSALARMGEG